MPNVNSPDLNSIHEPSNHQIQNQIDPNDINLDLDDQIPAIVTDKNNDLHNSFIVSETSSMVNFPLNIHGLIPPLYQRTNSNKLPYKPYPR